MGFVNTYVEALVQLMCTHSFEYIVWMYLFYWKISCSTLCGLQKLVDELFGHYQQEPSLLCEFFPCRSRSAHCNQSGKIDQKLLGI